MDTTHLNASLFDLPPEGLPPFFPNEDVYYLATPYSRFPGGVGAALRIANWATAGLAAAGYTCVSPILLCHGAQQLRPRPSGEWEHWRDFNVRLIHALPAMIFLHIGTPSIHSVGMKAEFQLFTELGKPTIVWEPGGIIPLTLVGHNWNPWAALPPEPQLRDETSSNFLQQLTESLKTK